MPTRSKFARRASLEIAKTRSDYKLDVQKQINDLNKTLDDVEVKAAEAKTQAKANASRAVADLRARHDVARQAQSISTATATQLDDLKRTITPAGRSAQQRGWAREGASVEHECRGHPGLKPGALRAEAWAARGEKPGRPGLKPGAACIPMSSQSKPAPWAGSR